MNSHTAHTTPDGSLRILLVEDNPGDARLTRELLREVGGFRFEMVHVMRFEQALTALRGERFDIVLLDLSLADSSGIETVKRLYAREPTVPMIVLSGMENDGVAMSALQEGAQDYLIKGQGDGNLITRAIRYAIERKSVEGQLVAAKNSAEAASRAKSEFLANVSHELRTPLNAIIGFSEILKQELRGPLGHPAYGDYVRDIHESGTHLLAVINDILDLSKIEIGQLTLSETPTDLGNVIESCLRIMRGRALQAGIEMSARIPPDLPLLNADDRMLKQVVLNLLSNAVKFTPKGGVVAIAAGTDVSADIDAGSGPEAEAGVFLRIADTGIGIAPEDIDRAMLPFVQIDSSLQRKYPGTGLGLPLARSMIELHGGRIELQSAAGAGTTVTVCFPASRNLSRARAPAWVPPAQEIMGRNDP